MTGRKRVPEVGRHERVIAIVQARTGSTRLPRKVLSDLVGRTMLERVVERIVRAAQVDGVVVATTSLAEDDAIVTLCQRRGWNSYRGVAEDVLDRYHEAAGAFGADVVVRITSDCPLIDPDILDSVVACLLGDRHIDYASNTLPPRTYPRGLDVEAFRAEALDEAWQEDTNPASREHVTPFIYGHPDQFRLAAVHNEEDFSHVRWTVDTADDLRVVEWIYRSFVDQHFSWRDALELVMRNPSVLEWNRHVVQKEVPGT